MVAAVVPRNGHTTLKENLDMAKPNLVFRWGDTQLVPLLRVVLARNRHFF